MWLDVHLVVKVSVFPQCLLRFNWCVSLQYWSVQSVLQWKLSWPSSVLLGLSFRRSGTFGFTSFYVFWTKLCYANKELQYPLITQSCSIKNFLTSPPKSLALSEQTVLHCRNLSKPCPLYFLSPYVDLLVLMYSLVSPYLHTLILFSFVLLPGFVRRQCYKSISGSSSAAGPLPCPAQLADQWLETPPKWSDCRQKAKLCLGTCPGLYQTW